EDPVDLYRVRLGARGRATARLRPAAGADVDLYAYSATAKALAGATPLSRSRRPGAATDLVRLRNTTNKARTYYLAVRAPAVARRTAVSGRYALQLAGR
ncbi:MAG: hypothetical protein JWR63_540, partial [Conexibacter sp.]|nr:hypothetical protein [Conexibacter sp.]